jgi:hypothetical protein
MKWIQRDNGVHLSAPYRIVSGIRGFSIWFSKKDLYGVLARELPTLQNAKDYCEAHKAKEEYQGKQLDAVFVK